MPPRSLMRVLVMAAVLVALAPAIPEALRDSTIELTSPAVAGISMDADRTAFLRDRASRNAESRRTRLVRPAPGKVTGPFGERRRGHSHPGIDIDGTTGDPVVAAATGTVAHAGPAPKGYGGYGQTVIIDHGNFQTLYAHLSRIDVVVGQPATAGDGVGAIGTTGSVTGSHLHFEVRVDGRPVDPATVMRW